MASPLASRAPHCLASIRRVPGAGESFRWPTGQQIRGKTKVARATTINVKLRKNIAGFGRKGSIVPVPPGVMRNSWFPRKRAEYQTLAQIKGLGDVAIERDSTFNPREAKRINLEKKKARMQVTLPTEDIAETLEISPAPPIEAAVPTESEGPIEPELLSPEQAATIVSKLVPADIEIYRKSIPPPSPTKRISSSLATNSALSAAAAAAAFESAERDLKRNSQKPTKTGIYGSVSTADIAENLKAILREDIEGARVTLSPADISFAEQLEDNDRIKHLGTFTYDIKFGPTESIRRTVTVKGTELDPR